MSEMRFDGQAVIVTGAGRGIGRGHARFLARRGAAVVVADAGVEPDGAGGSGAPAEAVVSEVAAEGGRAVACTASVADEDGARQIVAAALDHFGRLDAVINNAGIFAAQTIEAFDVELFRRHLDVHVTGSALVLRSAWPHLAQRQGRVVNTVSGSLFGMANYSAYISAKGAVLGLTRALAVEGRAAGIRVNCLAPGAATRLAFAGLPGLSDEARRQFSQAMPPEAIAPVAAYLAHPDCALNGECLSVAGGRVTRYILAETRGLTADALTPEAVRDRLAEIMDPEGVRIWPDTESMSVL